MAIQVHEFKDVLVICKKGIEGQAKLGTVYFRSAKPETVPANARIMREIVEMAVDKGSQCRSGAWSRTAGRRQGTTPFYSEDGGRGWGQRRGSRNWAAAKRAQDRVRQPRGERLMTIALLAPDLAGVAVGTV